MTRILGCLGIQFLFSNLLKPILLIRSQWLTNCFHFLLTFIGRCFLRQVQPQCLSFAFYGPKTAPNTGPTLPLAPDFCIAATTWFHSFLCLKVTTSEKLLMKTIIAPVSYNFITFYISSKHFSWLEKIIHVCLFDHCGFLN